MKVKYRDGNYDIKSIEIADGELKFVNGYAKVEFVAPDDPKHILRGIVSSEGKIVVEPKSAIKTITILPDKTAVIEKQVRRQNNISAFSGEHFCTYIEGLHIDLNGVNVNNDGLIFTLGSVYQILPNGNIRVKGHEEKNEHGRITQIGDMIYCPRLRRSVSPLMTEISEFTKDEKTGIFYAQTKISARETGSNTRFSLHGKMDMNGCFTSNIYNTATRGTISVSKEGFTLSDEIERTQEYIKNQEIIRKERIIRLPFINPVEVKR